ncbi:MAG TPA: aspartate/glutamate racemase family protein [Stellaceae bacterium]|nr:aspartate/glutamate racemase family protein [Stellaceae bacterium]
MPTSPRIALIHAVTVAMAPVHDSFRRLWPEAECVDILDTSLSRDRERDGELTGKMVGRFLLLAKYAEDNGADGILFTCSAFGEAIEQAAAKARIPVLKPNEAMFEAALAAGGRLGMLATFEPSVAGMEAEFRDIAGAARSPATLESHCVDGAMKALQGGDGAAHDRLLAQAAPRFADRDAVLLAHFSTSRAEAAVREAVNCPVLTAPGAAVTKLKQRIA